RESVAAWQTLLVASGIAVGFGDAAVDVQGMGGSGIPMASGELRLHALLGATSGKMPLTEIAHIIEGFGVFSEGTLAEDLLKDLTLGSASSNFITIFHALGADEDTFGDVFFGKYRAMPLEDVMLTGGQT